MLMFQSHPNISNILFKVLPMAREAFAHIDDVALRPEEVKQLFIDNKTINFDWSMWNSYGEPDLWQMNTTADLETIQKTMAAVDEPAKFGDSLYGLMHQNA